MKRFVVPPDWPTPPRRSWVPPKTWRPDPSWPPAPADWQFWVDGKGAPVRGPIGRYAGPSQRTVFAGAGAIVLVLGVVFWSLSAVGLFGGDGADAGAVYITGTSTTPTPTPVVPTKTPSARKTPTPIPSKTPVKLPHVSRTKEARKEPVKPTTPPKTTATTTKAPVPTKPTTTTSRPPTREELLRQYCIDRGWPPEWCVPKDEPTGR